MIVLGIETSCDETSASIVKDGCELLSVVTASSMDLHVAYGGVVPEIAARSHIESIIPVIDQALAEAFGQSSTKFETRNVETNLKNEKRKMKNEVAPNTNYQTPAPAFDPWSKVDAIAVTYGAGLGTSLLVGVMTARTLAIAKNKLLYAVNHVEGHVYANFISKTSLPGYKLPAKPPEFPILAVIVSGKHTQLVLFKDHFDYIVLGKTRDDAVGEAFDKVAKILGLPYPGGPSVSKAAENGDPHKFKLPKARLEEKYDFSFSGLKTAVLRLAQEQIGEDFTFPSYKLSERLSEAQKCDIAASFQRVAVETIVDKTIIAFNEFNPKSVIIAGGASANLELRRKLSEKLPITIDYTDIKLCTDNGAMIATLGYFMALNNKPASDPYSLEIQPSLKM